MVSLRRNVSLDLIKVVAVLAVILTHISAGFVGYYETSSVEFIFGNIFDSISRLGVPLFVMVSGSLMLDKERNITVKKILFKYVKNIALLLIFWSLLYTIAFNIILPIYYGNKINIETVISGFVLGHSHLWYLYMIIGLYLITPFLRLFVNEEHKSLVLLFIVISLAVQFTIPVLNGLAMIRSEFTLLIKLINKFELHFFFGYTTYYLTGWYLTHINIGNKMKKAMSLLWLPAIIITIIYVQNTGDYNNGYANTNIFIFIYAVGVFVLLYNFSETLLRDRIQNIIIHLSKLSFGVYIVHQLVLKIETMVFSYCSFPFLYIVCMLISTAVISFIGCYITSKIPGIRKLIRM